MLTNIIYFGLSAFVLYVGYQKISFAMNKNINHISAEEASELVKKNKDLVIIDVRTMEEYKSGHIPGAKSFPVGQVASRINELNKNKDKPVLVYCASGGRSPSAVKILLKNDFHKIYHLKRGLINWHYGLK